MAYTPYNPYAQNMAMNYPQPVQPMQQAQNVNYQPAPQMQMQTERRCETIPVSSYQQVKDFFAQPNTTTYFVNLQNREFYIKSADSFGLANVKAFGLTDIDGNTPEQPQSNAELQNLISYCNSLEQRIISLESANTSGKTEAKPTPEYAKEEKKK